MYQHLSPYRALRDDYVNWLKPYFCDGDFAITLTFRAYDFHFSNNYSPNYEKYNGHIHHFLNRLNRKFLGSHGRKGDAKVNVAYTFEQNYSSGVHVHMIMENSNHFLIQPEYRISTISNIWMGMRCSGYEKANHVVLAEDAQGWLSYSFKETNSNSTDKLFLDSWNLEPRISVNNK